MKGRGPYSSKDTPTRLEIPYVRGPEPLHSERVRKNPGSDVRADGGARTHTSAQLARRSPELRPQEPHNILVEQRVSHVA